MEKRKACSACMWTCLEMFRVFLLDHIEARTISILERVMCLDVCCVLCIPSGVVLVRYYGPNSETWFFKKNLGFF